MWIFSIAYAIAWISTAIGVVTGVYYTKSAWCLWAFLLPACMQIKFNNSDSGNGNNEEMDDKK